MKPYNAQLLDFQRDVMIRDHLKARGIRDQAVLKAMREVPREEFVNEHFLEKAYGDHPLPIAEGQTISQPYIVAYMTQSLELKAADRLLEIGTGSGYAAAVLSRIVTTVYSVEHLSRLVQEAQQRLERIGYTNIVIHEGDGTLGWPEHAPYDAIVVTAGAPEVPQPLLDQLAIGGRLVIPVGRFTDMQELIRVRRISECDYHSEELCGVRFVPLIGAAGW
jgi:protein-L-isoaspartate(D-aspartate) O-methyltransferase